MLRRGLGTAMSRLARGAVSPNTSSMLSSLGFIPSGNSHVKQCTKLATVISSAYNPSCIPGQDLLPDPNGMNSKLLPLKSGALWFKNLEGLKLSGSVHESLSRPMAHALIMTLDLAGIKYPATSASSAVSCRRRGMGGWRRRVSLMAQRK
ncbi:hypothetical protein Ancab_003205 [Ancistrocladus abbreviatus]